MHEPTRNIAPLLRIIAIVAVLVIGAIAGLAIKGSRGNISAGEIIFLFAIVIAAICAVIALDTDRARNARIEDPRDTWARKKRERDLS
jgi:hypothetical protein